MPSFSGVRWIEPPDGMARALELYGDRVLVAVQAVAGRIATIMENDAKAGAVWVDRTGNARSGLFGTAERDAAAKMVSLFLSHGPDLDYGIWLELANGGRYAVIMRTIEAHLPELRAELQAIFS